ncbi:MAG: c-type cytochrome [Candidatus Dadabacteria bacterium]|nr:c-type cytochrome [Candidatus Dadabacteria bacterium]
MGQVYSSLLLLIAFLVPLAVASAEQGAPPEGRRLFIEKRCYSCHTIKAEAAAIQKEKEAFAKERGVETKPKGEEDKIGVDLSDIGKRRDADSIRSFVKNPKPYFKTDYECKSKAKKKYRKRFKGTADEMDCLVGYLSGLKYESHQAADFKSCLKEGE